MNTISVNKDRPCGDYAIKEYHDTQAVMKKLNRLISQPIRRLKKEALTSYKAWFEVHYQKSKTQMDQAKEFIPGGVQHNLAFNYPFPLVFTEANGVPKNCFKYTQEFFPNDINDLKKKLWRNKFRGGTAAVLMEPIGPESGTRPLDKDFNKKVRELCDQYGALLIFDEVVTAFRMGMGGAQGYFNVTPDLTVFGKIIAGGYPSAGGLGGKREYMEYLAAGIQSGKKKALVGGTMAANPLSVAAGYHTLCEIEKTNAAVKAGRAGDRLTQGLALLIKKYNLPFVAFNQGSICHLETVGTMLFHIPWNRPWKIPGTIKQIHARKEVMEEMGAAYIAEGIVSLAGSRLYTSAADTDDIIDEALVRFERVFKNIEGV